MLKKEIYKLYKYYFSTLVNKLYLQIDDRKETYESVDSGYFWDWQNNE